MVLQTLTRQPSASMAGAARSSTVSIDPAVDEPGRSAARRRAPTARRRARSSSWPAGPSPPCRRRSAKPRPPDRRDLSASLTPGSARIGSMLTNGFEGVMMTAAGVDERMRRKTSLGVALAAPSKRHAAELRPALHAARNNPENRAGPRRCRRCCGPGSSHIGATVCAMPRRCASSAVTSDSVRPAASASVRSTWVARSRSPSLNQVAPPICSIAAMKFQVSPAGPSRVGVVAIGQRVEHRVDVGRDVQAEVHEIVRGVDDDGELFRRKNGGKAARQLSAADAAGQSEHKAFVAMRSLSGTGRARGRGSGRRPSRRRPEGAAQQHHRRALGGLTHQQRGGGGDLVGDADLGGAQRAAEQVAACRADRAAPAGPRRRAPRRRCRSATRGQGCR